MSQVESAKQLYKVSFKNKLNEDNWYVYYQELSDYLNAFGKAGQEIREGKRIEFTYPVRTRIVTYTIMDEEGNEEEVEREWKASDERQHLLKIDKIEASKELYNKQRAELWIFLVTNMEKEVLERLKTQQTEYDKLQTDVDTLGLFELMKSKLLEADSNRAPLVRQRWHELRQVDPATGHTMSLMELLGKFESYIKMLHGTNSAPSMDDQVQQLLTALMPGRYSSYTERIITEKKTPDIQDMKECLMRLENSLPKLKNKPADIPADNLAMLTLDKAKSNNNSNNKNNNNKGKFNSKNKERNSSKTKANKFHKKSVNKPEGTVCHNCGIAGHISRMCTKPKINCQICTKLGHLAKYCRQLLSLKNPQNTANNNKGKQQRDNTPEDNVNSITITPNDWNDERLYDSEESVLMISSNEAINTIAEKTSTNLLLDSGASVHVFINDLTPKILGATIEQPPTHLNLSGISGNRLNVTGMGYINNLGRFYISPDATTELLSIAELIKQQHYSVLFSGDVCKIELLNTDNLVRPLVLTRANNSFYISIENLKQLITLPKLVANVLTEELIAFEVSQPASARLFSKEQYSRALEVINLHILLNHPSNATLINALNNGVIVGTHLTATDVANAETLFGACTNCIAGKTTKSSFKHNSTTPPAQKVGELVHVDIHSFPNKTIGGNSVYLTCLDEFSGYLSIISCNSKHSKELIKAFEHLISIYSSYKHCIDTIEVDHESALLGCELYLGNKQIKMIATPPYQHAQRIERTVRTLNNRMRTVLNSIPYEFPDNLRGELLLAICGSMNDLPNKQHKTLSPKIIFEGRRFDLNRIKHYKFGSILIAHTAGKESDRLAARSEVVIALGPSTKTYNAIRCCAIATGRIVIRNKFTSLKGIPEGFPFALKKQLTFSDKPVINNSPLIVQTTPEPALSSPIVDLNTDYHEDHETNTFIESTANNYNTNNSDAIINAEENAINIDSEVNSSRNGNSSSTTNNDNINLETITSDQEGNLKDSLPRTKQNTKTKKLKFAEYNLDELSDYILRRSNRQRKPKQWSDSVMYSQDFYFETEEAFRISVSSALKSKYSSQSKLAIIDEINNMIQYNVGTYIKYKDISYELRRFILPSFMFIKHKHRPDGTYERTKARIVGDGSKQTADMFDIISSSTVTLTSVFLLLNIATRLRARTVSYDIKGAFLNVKKSPNENPIFLRIRKEVADVWVTVDPSAAEYVDERGELIIELNKYMYGLKQAPVMFQKHLIQLLLSNDYTQCKHDECIFTKSNGSDISILSTHVDDILQVSTSEHFIEELKQILIDAYQHITFNSTCDAYLGMKMLTNNSRSVIKLSQQGLIKDILKQHLKDKPTRPANTPADNNLFVIDDSSPQLSPSDRKNLLSVVMSLMYIARLTRPDILLPVTFLASRVHCSTKQDNVKLDRVLRYLQNTVNKQLIISCDKLELNCYCDASYGTHHDGKSHTGYIFKLGQSYLFARSIKQKLTALSSTDAEIIAATSAATTATWLRELQNEILNSLPQFYCHSIVLYQDNKSGIWLATKPSKYRRSKHLLTKLTYLKDLHNQSILKFVYLNTTEMKGDLLTKPLQGSPFQKHTNSMMGQT